MNIEEKDGHFLAFVADIKREVFHHRVMKHPFGIGKHEEATEAFKKAMEAGAANPKIAENTVLKKHLGM